MNVIEQRRSALARIVSERSASLRNEHADDGLALLLAPLAAARSVIEDRTDVQHWLAREQRATDYVRASDSLTYLTDEADLEPLVVSRPFARERGLSRTSGNVRDQRQQATNAHGTDPNGRPLADVRVQRPGPNGYVSSIVETRIGDNDTHASKDDERAARRRAARKRAIAEAIADRTARERSAATVSADARARQEQYIA